MSDLQHKLLGIVHGHCEMSGDGAAIDLIDELLDAAFPLLYAQSGKIEEVLAMRERDLPIDPVFGRKGSQATWMRGYNKAIVEIKDRLR